MLSAELIKGFHRILFLRKTIRKGVGSFDLRSSAMTAEIKAVITQMIIAPIAPRSKITL